MNFPTKNFEASGLFFFFFFLSSKSAKRIIFIRQNTDFESWTFKESIFSPFFFRYTLESLLFCAHQ